MKPNLLNRSDLENSAVVANNRMNRQRKAIGVNSYAKDLDFNPIQFLEERKGHDPVRWLDLCCGEGQALIQAAQNFFTKGNSTQYELEGLDLVDFFQPYHPQLNLSLNVLNLENWIPKKDYDLITVVHGLHYVGDKIEVIRKAVSSLSPNGFFIANLDARNIIIHGAKNPKQQILYLFQKNGLDYSTRKRLLSAMGKKTFECSLDYLGADDSAGPNYTRQEVVDSYYSAM